MVSKLKVKAKPSFHYLRNDVIRLPKKTYWNLQNGKEAFIEKTKFNKFSTFFVEVKHGD